MKNECEQSGACHSVKVTTIAITQTKQKKQKYERNVGGNDENKKQEHKWSK